MVKLLWVEKAKKKDRVNLVFVAGGRVLKYLGRSVAVEKALTTVLKYVYWVVCLSVCPSVCVKFGVCGGGPGTEVPRTECSCREGSHHSSQVCILGRLSVFLSVRIFVCEGN